MTKSEELFTRMYRDHERLVRGHLYRMGARAQLDDLVQEVFMKAWDRLEQLRSLEAARSWFYRITISTLSDWARKGSWKEEATDAPPETGRHQETELKILVQEALRRLPLEQRTVTVMHYLEDNSVEEIAGILEIPTGTVKSRLAAARARLQGILNIEVAS